MSVPMFSVGGLASGLDTDGIIRRLMEVERTPVVRLQQRRTGYQAKVDAWGQVRTRFSALRTAVDTLKRTSDLDAFAKATSSNEAVASVSVGGSAGSGSVTFTVDRLASLHRIAGDGTFASKDAVVGAGTFTVTVDGTDHTVTTTSTTTLAQLAQQITGLDAGVTAGVLQVDESTATLVLSAAGPGAGAVFTASGTQTGLATFSVVEQGVDAQLTVGSGPGALTVTRSSNTIADLLDGVSITLNSTSATAVTVTSSRDVDAMVTAIKGFVDEVNKALATLTDLTKYDAATKKAGALQGDSSAWRLAGELRRSVSDALAGVTGSYRAASSLGITLGRDGTFSIDETKLRAAISTDFDGVAQALARSGSATDARVSFVAATDDTQPGTYAVQITQAAAQASGTGSLYVPPVLDQAFTITAGATTVDVTVTALSTLSSAVDQVNAALDAAGVATLEASDDGAGAIRLTSTIYGSSTSFAVSGSGTVGIDGTFTGTDVAGTIDGAAATGSGQILTASSGDAEGLALRITATPAEVSGTLDLGSVTYSQGVVARVSAFVGLAEGVDGLIGGATDRWKSQIEVVDDQVKVYEDRLTMKEQMLRRRFAQMETTLSNLQAQTSYLFSQLSAQAPQ